MTRLAKSPVGSSTLPLTVAPLSEVALAWRFEAVAKALGVSRRTLERERAAGRFPKADLYIGKMPLWRPETIRAWIESGGRS